MSKELLKPCPACGGRLFLTVRDRHGIPAEKHQVFWVRCSCGVCGPVKYPREDAVAAWNALPRRLRWTKTPPTVKGRYYYRKLGAKREPWESLGIADVDFNGGCLVAARAFTNLEPVTGPKWDGFEWAGPLPEPEDSIDES